MVLTAVLSEGCNLDCAYCGVDKRSTKRVDVALLLGEYQNLRTKSPEEPIRIDFFGGEPLMYMGMVRDIVDATCNDPLVSYKMHTNGVLMTQELADYFSAHNILVSLSFDGLWQDKNRLQLTGRHTSSRILNKKEVFKSIPNLIVHTVITSGCYNLLDNHLFIYEQFGTYPEMALVKDVGVWKPASVANLNAGVTELVNWCISNPDLPIPPLIDTYLNSIISYHRRGYTRDYCGAGRDIVMFSDNKLLPCTRFKDREDLIPLIPQFTRMPACETCEVKHYCSKGCLIEQMKNGQPITELCDVYKHIYSEVQRMVAALQHNHTFLYNISGAVQ
jgi:uncharacterized protein